MPAPNDSCTAPNLLLAACPSRRALDLVANRWAVLTLYAVGAGISRHGELRRRIEGVTSKMLTQTLRELERCGLVHRELFAQAPPRVEYTLTGLGRSLLTVVQALCDWAVPNMALVEQAQAAFDARTEPAAPWVRTG